MSSIKHRNLFVWPLYKHKHSSTLNHELTRARLPIIVLIAIGFVGTAGIYAQWRLNDLKGTLLHERTVSATTQQRLSILYQRLDNERQLYHQLTVGSLVAGAGISASLAYHRILPHLPPSAQLKSRRAHHIRTKSATSNAKQLQAQAHAAEAERSKYEAILNSITDGMVITDLKGNILLLNAPGQGILGISATSWLGQPFYKTCKAYDQHSRPISNEDHPLHITLQHGQKCSRDVILHPSDPDNKKIINITTSAIMQQQEQIGAIALLRDITHEKEVDRMKTEFIVLASHQLRTPLSAIRWFSEMLSNGDAGKLQPEQAEFIQNIVSSASRMTDLVKVLLNLSRIESGQVVIDPQPTDLRKLLDTVVQNLHAEIKDKRHHISIDVSEDLPKVNLDPQLIGQVYANFLTNAITYTQKEGHISIKVWQKDSKIISRISDNGYGIPQAYQSKLFQKFFRAPNATGLETDGSGLGLYLIKAILDSTGGRIWYSSKEGRGSTFWFSLPAGGMRKRHGEVRLEI